MIRVLLFFSILISTQSLIAQIQNPNLEKELLEEDLARRSRIKEFLKVNPQVKVLEGEDGFTAVLTDIVHGQPIYTSTHNLGTAISIGVDAMRNGGGLGLNLTGEGVRVGVWDQRVPRQSHVEFANRLVVNEAGEVSDHATHTLGTIIASGVNASARGMAYEAMGVSYDWNDDASEMLTEASSFGLLVSNHSYGPLAGWVPSLGQWFGDASVSSEEDYKFGFYDSRARAWDAVVVNHPFYTICKSAGNDRGDSGNGTFPPDGSFDIIATYATAKNIITVGAVQKTDEEINSPGDIVMSSFSSWGPTDDGRIKPDICAPGVSVFSTVSSNDEAYSSFSGTSMATPAVAGACVLLQQLHNNLNGSFMWTSALKGLIIHTAHEAGAADGPDYQYGWGMINAEKAAKFLIENDGTNNFLIQDQISDGQTMEIELNPIANKKITATIAWTDQPGNVPAVSLDPSDLILVNDLDMRIVDEAGNEVMPWILDPATPGIAAKTGDNFRDNIEKIEFSNPEQRKYFLRITHKGSLAGGMQDFSLIVSYESENTGLTNLYWIGNTGNWDNGDNWSMTSGGAAAGTIPSIENRAIFDENSFSGSDGYTVSLTKNESVGSVIWLAPEVVNLDLSGFILTTQNSSQLSQESLTVENGGINLINGDNDTEKNLSISKSNTNALSLRINNTSSSPWLISPSTNKLDSIVVLSGEAKIVSDDTLKIESIFLNSNTGLLDLSNLIISDIAQIDISANSILYADNTDLIFSVESEGNVRNSGTLNEPSIFIRKGKINIIPGSDHFLKSLTVSQNAEAIINMNLNVDDFYLDKGVVTLNENAIMNIENDFLIEADNENKAIIQSETKGIINIIPHKKFCFDHMAITNVDLSGSASVSVGNNSDLINSVNWFVGECDELIFSNFEVQFPCAKGLTYLIDRSEGAYTDLTWSVDGIIEGGDPTLFLEFDQPGEKEVTLSVGTADVVSQFTQTIQISESNQDSNFIIVNSTQLASFKTGDTYQWFKDGNLIEGETSRVYLHNDEPGVYFVLTFSDGCNRKSSSTTLVSTSSEELPGISIFPNPIGSEPLMLESRSLSLEKATILISDQLGKIFAPRIINKNFGNISIDVNGLPSGIYYLQIVLDDQKNVYKINKR